MPDRSRTRTLIAVAAVAAVAGASGAWADTAVVTPLAGDAGHASAVTRSSFRVANVTHLVSGGCTFDYNFDTDGTSNRLYPGTFSGHGTVTLGPVDGVDTAGIGGVSAPSSQVLNVTGGFAIESPSTGTHVTGTLVGPAGGQVARGWCDSGLPGDPTAFIVGALANIDFRAVIVTPAGAVIDNGSLVLNADALGTGPWQLGRVSDVERT